MIDATSAGSAELCTVSWRKSRRSGSGGGHCVEVGFGAARTGVRDSKDQDGPALWFSAGAWFGFLGAVKRGELD